MKKIFLLTLFLVLFSCNTKHPDAYYEVEVYFLDGTVDTLITLGSPAIDRNNELIGRGSWTTYATHIKYFKVLEPCAPTK